MKGVKKTEEHKAKISASNQGIGRPTSYKEEYDQYVYKLALLGHTDKEMSAFFDVSESTFNLWKLEHHTFSEFINKGKALADFEVVQALYKAATGFVVDDVKVFQFQGAELVVPYKRVVDGDVTAQKKWLSARQRKIWSESLSFNGGINEDGTDKPIQAEVTVKKLSTELLEKINDELSNNV